MSKYLGPALIFVGLLLMLSYFNPKDDTDPPDGRSGIALHVDHLTGCQYLAKSLGGITPRLDGKGRHVGCKDQ